MRLDFRVPICLRKVAQVELVKLNRLFVIFDRLSRFGTRFQLIGFGVKQGFLLCVGAVGEEGASVGLGNLIQLFGDDLVWSRCAGFRDDQPVSHRQGFSEFFFSLLCNSLRCEGCCNAGVERIGVSGRLLIECEGFSESTRFLRLLGLGKRGVGIGGLGIGRSRFD